MTQIYYAELFLLENLLSLLSSTPSEPKKACRIKRTIKSFKGLEAKEQLRLLDDLIAELEPYDSTEIAPPFQNNAVFDSYFRIKRIRTIHVEVIARSSLKVFRNALSFYTNYQDANLPEQEWQTILTALLIIIEKGMDIEPYIYSKQNEEAYT